MDRALVALQARAAGSIAGSDYAFASDRNHRYSGCVLPAGLNFVGDTPTDLGRFMTILVAVSVIGVTTAFAAPDVPCEDAPPEAHDACATAESTIANAESTIADAADQPCDDAPPEARDACVAAEATIAATEAAALAAAREHGRAALAGLPDQPWTSFNDGAGSGLDADLLDGLDSSVFMDALATHVHDDRYYTKVESDGRFLAKDGKAADSDRLDGLDSSQVLRSDTSGTLNGNLVVNGRVGFGTSPDSTIHMRGGQIRNDEGARTWWNRLNSGGFEYVIGATPDNSDPNIKLKLDYDGNLAVTGRFNARGGFASGDIVEPATGSGVQPGDVVVLGAQMPNGKLAVELATTPRDPLVAGVVSTAPSFQLAGLPTDIPLAVTGIVPVKVDASYGPIAKGDLLTSSATPGHAMRCDPSDCVGAIIGKAIDGLDAGRGSIRMIVSLG